MKWVVDPQQLHKLYWDEKKSTAEIGRFFGVDAVTIRSRMREYGIPVRTVSESLKGRKILWADKIGKASLGKRLTAAAKRKISKARKGQPSWNRGLTKAQHQNEFLMVCREALIGLGKAVFQTNKIASVNLLNIKFGAKQFSLEMIGLA